MRTTVTIDADTENLLREEVRRTGCSFKEVLNRSIRQSLLASPGRTCPVGVTALFPAPFPSELQETNFNHLANELDDEATLREMGA
jgi:hypothetical protein